MVVFTGFDSILLAGLPQHASLFDHHHSSRALHRSGLALVSFPHFCLQYFSFHNIFLMIFHEFVIIIVFGNLLHQESDCLGWSSRHIASRLDSCVCCMCRLLVSQGQ
jgi:hypothetical protein